MKPRVTVVGSLNLAAGSTRESIPGIHVDAVDTTAAGDAFAGALAVALAEGKELAAAVRFANAVGALSVTRMGAQPSMPKREEVAAFARERGLQVQLRVPRLCSRFNEVSDPSVGL